MKKDTLKGMLAWGGLSLLGILSSNQAAQAKDFAHPNYPGSIVCKVQNLRGAQYYGRSFGVGQQSRDAACNEALGRCLQDSVLPRTCHVVDTWYE